MESKECIKCHQIKELLEFSLREYPNGHRSYRGECKECCKIRQEKYHAGHKEEIKNWHKLYYQNNKEKLKTKNNEWWDKNRDKMNNHRKNKRQRKIILEIPKINEENIYNNWI